MSNLELKQVKKEYLDLINLIVKYRKETLGKVGIFGIPKQKITTKIETHLTDFAEQLESDEIIKKHIFQNNSPELFRLIGNQYKFYNFKKWEEIEKYKYTLWYPGGQNLTFTLTEGITTVLLPPNRLATFNNYQKIVIDYLYKNKNVKVPHGDFEDLNLPRPVKGYISDIRGKFIDSFGLSTEAVDNILPRYTKGYYILKA